MDIERLKKINDLAIELKKHNLAQTSDEAAKLAEEFYKQNSEEKTEEQKKPKIEEKENEIKTKEQQTGKKPEQEDKIISDSLTEKKIELMFEIQEKKVMQDLEYVRSTVNFLKNRMELLNEEVEKLKGKAISSPISFQKKENEKETQANLQTKKESDQEKSPRSGKYSSKDVDIQKMFYFGNKNAQD
jgi:hypothetical protein